MKVFFSEVLKQIDEQKCINKNSRLKFNPGLALIVLWTTGPSSVFFMSWIATYDKIVEFIVLLDFSFK